MKRERARHGIKAVRGVIIRGDIHGSQRADILTRGGPQGDRFAESPSLYNDGGDLRKHVRATDAAGRTYPHADGIAHRGTAGAYINRHPAALWGIVRNRKNNLVLARICASAAVLHRGRLAAHEYLYLHRQIAG